MRNIKSVGYMLILFISLFAFNKISAYKSYNIGDEVTYNDIKFYVIKNSSSDEDSITLLKAEPLTVDEVSLYGGAGTENNHVNRYTYYSRNEVGDIGEDGYGGMTFYSSETCVSYFRPPIYTGCTNDYVDSDVKYAVDGWTLAKIGSNDLVADYTGYKVRLITIDDLKQLGYVKKQGSMGYYYDKSDDVPTWLYNSNYYYWTMSPPTYIGTKQSVIAIQNDGNLSHEEPIHSRPDDTVRPVINLKKSAIEKEEMIIDDNTEKSDTKQNENKNITNERKDIVDIVKVPNTMQKVSIVFILLGVTLVSISTIILIHNRNKIKK